MLALQPASQRCSIGIWGNKATAQTCCFASQAIPEPFLLCRELRVLLGADVVFRSQILTRIFPANAVTLH